ncbi:MAG: DUF1338 domain-containing protein, partial [Myxococcota bacterium]
MNASTLFEHLWSSYTRITPSASTIHAQLQARGESILNDHVALRTFDLDPIGLDMLAEPFQTLGWEPSGNYTFEAKRLNARSFRPPSPDLPHVFISELRTGDFSPKLQATAKRLASAAEGRSGTDLLTEHPTWPAVDWATYQALLTESEYAGWLSVFGLCANHFTVAVHQLDTFDGLASLNTWLQEQGWPLNDSGGLIKGGPDVYLAQSSTVADRITHTFACGHTAEIPSCYVEFA